MPAAAASTQTEPGRKNTSMPHSSGYRGPTTMADSGTVRSWLPLAELGGPISAAGCCDRPLRPLKGTWCPLLTDPVMPAAISTGPNLGTVRCTCSGPRRQLAASFLHSSQGSFPAQHCQAAWLRRADPQERGLGLSFLCVCVNRASGCSKPGNKNQSFCP